MTAEAMMKEYKNMKKELTVTEFQLRQFQGVSEQDMIDSMLYSHQEGERVQTSTLSDKTANIAIKYKAAMERENDEWYDFLFHRYMFLKEELVSSLCFKTNYWFFCIRRTFLFKKGRTGFFRACSERTG